MRLFVAVDIDDTTRAQLPRVRDAIEPAIAQAAVPPRVAWVRDQSAHVTLRFIGEVSEAVGERVMSELTSGFAMPAFEIRWEQLGTFPPPRPGGRFPKVIWIGATSGQQALAALAARVNERLAPIVGPGDLRPFKAHLTIGRVKEAGRGVDWGQALAQARLEPTTTLVDHVTVYQSRLSAKGPTYTALCQSALATEAKVTSSKFKVQS